MIRAHAIGASIRDARRSEAPGASREVMRIPRTYCMRHHASHAAQVCNRRNRCMVPSRRLGDFRFFMGEGLQALHLLRLLHAEGAAELWLRARTRPARLDAARSRGSRVGRVGCASIALHGDVGSSRGEAQRGPHVGWSAVARLATDRRRFPQADASFPARLQPHWIPQPGWNSARPTPTRVDPVGNP